MLGDAWRSLVHSDDLESATSSWRHSLETGDELAAEYRLRSADGEYRWYAVSAAPLREANGTIIRWFGTIDDVEQRKSIERSLTESSELLVDSQRRFRALADSIPVICWTADANGWIDWYNHRWYEFTGQTAEDSRGWGWQAAHHPDDFLDVMRSWPRSIETGESF
jgi:PAS domain-containing protein